MLPDEPIPTPDQHEFTDGYIDDIKNMHAMVDSDWAGDTKHRKSVSGIVLKLAGGVLLYKTKYQDTIALSSTEAEFAAACDAGKCILYIRSILDEINMPQEHATTLFIDNNGALLMGNSQKPTRCTRHVATKQFAILDWVEKDSMILKHISTSHNASDGMTKALGRILHYRHFDYIMGRIPPKYTERYILKQDTTDIKNKKGVPNTQEITPLYDDKSDSKIRHCSKEQGGDIIPTRL